MHRAELTVRPGSLFARSVMCRAGNISRLEPHELYTARAVTGMATAPQGFCWGDHKGSVLTAVSECSLPASWSMRRAPGMFHLACLVICHWLLPWRMERQAKLEVLRTRSSLSQVKHWTQQHQRLQSSILCHAQALWFFRQPKASLDLCSCTKEK